MEMGLIYLTRLLLKKALKENKNIILGVAQFWEALLMCYWLLEVLENTNIADFHKGFRMLSKGVGSVTHRITECL